MADVEKEYEVFVAYVLCQNKIFIFMEMGR